MGPLGLCLWFALNHGGHGLVYNIVLSPLTFLECVEGRGLAGSATGLLLGLGLTGVGIWIDVRRRRRERLAEPS